MDAGTVIAIVVPNVVTATAIVVAWKQNGRVLRAGVDRQRARLRHERAMHDLDELRGLLDLGASALDDVRASVDQPSGPGWVEQALVRLGPLRARFTVRLGEQHSVTNIVQAASDAMRDIEELYANASARSEADEEEFFASLGALRDEVSHQAERYYDAAARLAGARLTLESGEQE